MPKIKSIPWKKPCLVVGTISTREGLAALNRSEPNVDIAEVRYDILRRDGMTTDELIPFLEKRKTPVLLTLRTTREGGRYPWKSRERVLAFESLIPCVDAIDIEVHNFPLVKSVVIEARRQKVAVILSFHALQRKLTYERAQRLVSQLRRRRVRAFKIAALARNRKDLGVLARVLLETPQLRLGVMALGPMAGLSCRTLPALGSKLVYGYIDKPATKGDPSVQEITASMPRL